MLRSKQLFCDLTHCKFNSCHSDNLAYEKTFCLYQCGKFGDKSIELDGNAMCITYIPMSED